MITDSQVEDMFLEDIDWNDYITIIEEQPISEDVTTDTLLQSIDWDDEISIVDNVGNINWNGDISIMDSDNISPPRISEEIGIKQIMINDNSRSSEHNVAMPDSPVEDMFLKDIDWNDHITIIEEQSISEDTTTDTLLQGIDWEMTIYL